MNEREYLFFLLARREYSKAELKEKLTRRGKLTAKAIESLVDEFAEKNWQSDIRCAETVIRVGIAKNYGKARIRQKLIYDRKIAADLADEALTSAAINWPVQAEKCYQKKYRDQAIIDYQDKQKRLQYLLRQGFDYQVAVKILENR